MNKNEALARCRLHWINVRNNPKHKKIFMTVKLREFDKLYLHLNKHDGPACAACLYHKEHSTNDAYYCYKRCIIDWGSKDGFCDSIHSPYYHQDINRIIEAIDLSITIYDAKRGNR